MTVDYTRIRRELANFLGLPTDTSQWSSDDTARIADVISSGMDMVIHPPIIKAFGPRQHQWTWLRPVWGFTTEDGQRYYELPPDFEDFCEPLYYAKGQGAYDPLEIVPPSRLRHLESQWQSTGRPLLAAVEPLSHDGTEEAHYKRLVLHPTPDGEYKLVTRYQVGVRTLTSANPYPPGGPEHGELFLAACLAVAEDRYDDESLGQKKAAFLEMLGSHIAADLQRLPKRLGYMGDGPRRGWNTRSSQRNTLDLTQGYTTYNGGTDL